ETGGGGFVVRRRRHHGDAAGRDRIQGLPDVLSQYAGGGRGAVEGGEHPLSGDGKGGPRLHPRDAGGGGIPVAASGVSGQQTGAGGETAVAGSAGSTCATGVQRWAVLLSAAGVSGGDCAFENAGGPVSVI